MLKRVLMTLKLRDQECYRLSGRRRFWVVQSIEEVALSLKQKTALIEARGLRPRTFDFTTMYTKLPHAKLLEELRVVLTEACDFAAATTSRVDATRASDALRLVDGVQLGRWTWTSSEGLSLEELMERIEALLANLFVCNGSQLRQQVIGLPMGTNCAPQLANLYCYSVECRYMDQHPTCPAHDLTFRFIDDFLTFAAEALPSQDDYEMAYAETTSQDCCHFLGMRIALEDGRLRMSILDKRDTFPFQLMKYPSAMSDIPLHQTSGVLISQLVCYGVVSNNLMDFEDSTKRLVVRLLERGHAPKALLRGWNGYVLSHWDLNFIASYRVRSWFRRMLTWALHHHAPEGTLLPSQLRLRPPKSKRFAAIARSDRSRTEPPFADTEGAAFPPNVATGQAASNTPTILNQFSESVSPTARAPHSPPALDLPPSKLRRSPRPRSTSGFGDIFGSSLEEPSSVGSGSIPIRKTLLPRWTIVKVKREQEAAQFEVGGPQCPRCQKHFTSVRGVLIHLSHHPCGKSAPADDA